MLVEDNGKITGAISGGCLEGDALRKALLAINQQQNKLVTYNTLHDDDVEFGVQLGCNGIVHILFEPIDPATQNHPVALLRQALSQRKEAVVVTLFSLINYNGPQPGTCFFTNGENTWSSVEEEALEADVKRDATGVLSGRESVLKSYGDEGQMGFVELLKPPVSLVVIGAGNDALPLVEMASLLGWEITVIDGRSTHATAQRFSKADRILIGKPADILPQISIDQQTVFVLMTHNFNYDRDMLKLLLQEKCTYIGTLGPRKRLERMLAELEEQGFTLTPEHRAMLYGPTGLDIGAEASEEIALSVLAEIKAVLAGRSGQLLRDRKEGIHTRSGSALA